MDKEFINQILAFQNKARQLATTRIEVDCEVKAYIFTVEGVRVIYDWPHYQGSGSILIPWSDLLFDI